MNRKHIQVIHLLPILFLVPYVLNGYPKQWFEDHNLFIGFLLSGGIVGIVVVIISLINWIIYGLIKKDILIHTHSIFILLYGYLQTLNIWSAPPPDKIDFRAFDTWIITSRVTLILIINLILFITIKTKKETDITIRST